MSYTHAKVLWKACEVINSSIVDEYGDITRQEAKYIIARKQPHEEVYQDSNGRELLTKSYFYVDPNVEPNALSINKMDTLDGETIVSIYQMCDLYNNIKLIRFITV